MSEFVPAGRGLGWRRRPLAAALRLRPPVAHRASVELELLERHARAARCAVEVGVDEGSSASLIRRAMDPAGVLFLVDPFPAGRLGISLTRLVARRTVHSIPRGRVVWIREWTQEASRAWEHPIDFAHLDGDQTFEGVHSHWDDWSPHVRIGGKIMLSGARVGVGSWVQPSHGPARLFETVIASDKRWKPVDEACSALVLERTSVRFPAAHDGPERTRTLGTR